MTCCPAESSNCMLTFQNTIGLVLLTATSSMPFQTCEVNTKEMLSHVSVAEMMLM